MRIIAGKYRGRLIEFPKHIRPTQDRVRQSVFDVLTGVIKGARVLDLFAGSGAIGLEALSRGAKEVYFVEKDRYCSRVIEANLLGLGVKRGDPCARTFTNESFRALEILKKKKESFDIVFIDPPYYQELAKKALKLTVASGILSPYSFVVVEHAKKDMLGECPAGCDLVKEIVSGEIKVSIYRKSE